MTNETARLTQQLADLLKTNRAHVVRLAIYHMAIVYHLAGCGHDWDAEAVRRGYRKAKRKAGER